VNRFAAALPSCRIEWDGGVIEPKPSDADRSAAEWVLSIGGSVGLYVGDEGRRLFRPGEKLPSGALKIDYITFRGLTIQNDDLRRLVGLRDLEQLVLDNTAVDN